MRLGQVEQLAGRQDPAALARAPAAQVAALRVPGVEEDLARVVVDAWSTKPSSESMPQPDAETAGVKVWAARWAESCMEDCASVTAKHLLCTAGGRAGTGFDPGPSPATVPRHGPQQARVRLSGTNSVLGFWARARVSSPHRRRCPGGPAAACQSRAGTRRGRPARTARPPAPP